MTGSNSEAKPDAFAAGLWGPAMTSEGDIYGITVDCNPTLIWYNKGVLQDANISDDPMDLYENGEWKWDVFLQMCEQVASQGNINGFMFENGNNWFYSWCRQNGGTPYEGDACIVNEDAKSVEAFQWMYDNIESGAFTYAGNLPTGQAADAQFNSSRTAFMEAGRWVLPVYKENPEPQVRRGAFPHQHRRQDGARMGCHGLHGYEQEDREREGHVHVHHQLHLCCGAEVQAGGGGQRRAFGAQRRR